MLDDNESTCVSKTSLVQLQNRYFAQLKISKYQASMGSSVGLRVKFSGEINCKLKKVVHAFRTLSICESINKVPYAGCSRWGKGPKCK